MDEDYNQFQILIDQINLPERNLQDNITICNVSGKDDYHKVLDLFLMIFPDEIDSGKARDLREVQVEEYEGIFLAKLNDEIIGFLASGIYNQVGYITYLGVLEKFRSQGIATALLKRFKLYLNEKKVQKIRCKISKDNKKTLGYVHYLGFQLF
ncbi:MAG: GNAT family N-acetyltransferase [Candidatus Helarchaeota archaeon]|nr:GNAT family N-acetyltransferase [Candidatus Helarchaeota archaeon]